MEMRFTSSRENTVRFLKEAAQYIYDNADERKERFRKFFKNKKGDRKWNI